MVDIDNAAQKRAPGRQESRVVHLERAAERIIASTHPGCQHRDTRRRSTLRGHRMVGYRKNDTALRILADIPAGTPIPYRRRSGRNVTISGPTDAKQRRDRAMLLPKVTRT